MKSWYCLGYPRQYQLFVVLWKRIRFRGREGVEEDGKGLGFECGKWEMGPRKDFKGPPRGLRGGGSVPVGCGEKMARGDFRGVKGMGVEWGNKVYYVDEEIRLRLEARLIYCIVADFKILPV